MYTRGKIRLLVDAANNQVNPILDVSLQVLCQNHSTSIECLRLQHLTQEIKTWIFELFQRNMKHLYEISSWGWNMLKKKEELFHDLSWYIIAKKEHKPVGFCHFRFDEDHTFPVLYCYEVQVEESMKRKGIGKHFLDILQKIAVLSHMKKIVLTVFTYNKNARSFFRSQGYTLDETSPGNEVDECDYVILSKYI